MRFTIERIRTVVLIAGVLLIAALGVFLTIGHWKSPFNRRDLPKKLGIDIQQEANGFTHAEFHAGHALFKITASKVEQLKNDRYRLHSVKIEMYSPNGGGTDWIEGSEFEYDQQAGIATAAGPVEITLERPENAQSNQRGKTAKASSGLKKDTATNPPADDDESRRIHVKTIGLTFNQKNGVASSSNHVEFNLPQASGSANGAVYDSQHGHLILNSAVELNTSRGPDPARIQAQHAEYDRDDDRCDLVEATARYRHGDARATRATVAFRDDGTVQQLDATSGFVLTTATGGHLAAPTGSLQFDEDNQPKFGHLQGGVIIDSDSDGRTLHGTAPTADLQFTSEGLLRHAHLERDVNFTADEQAESAGVPLHAHRVWTSPQADLEFRNAGKGQVELSTLHGTGGVLVTSENQRGNAAATHARMKADEIQGTFASNSVLSAMTGTGHAFLEQINSSGTRQTTTGDRVEAHFTTAKPAADRNPKVQHASGDAVPSQIESATLVGNVVLVQQAAAKPGGVIPGALRATAQRADYDGASDLLHLKGRPHVEDGGLELDAEAIDLARGSGDAFAHGAVKATWFGNDAAPDKKQAPPTTPPLPDPGLGTQGPTHVVSSEAQLHQATGEATFRGNARLWQQGNSIAAPVIVLDRTRQTLVARTTSAADPVKVVLVSAASTAPGKTGKGASPSVIRVRGGDLKYSSAERKAMMQGGIVGTVVGETGDATTHSKEVDLTLFPPGNHAAKDGSAAQVDRMTARGDVTINSQGRYGTGEKLEYFSERDEYVLTGTAAAPPRMTDPTRGTVSGESLIFNSRDGSVNVEGGERATTAETTVPKK